MNYLVIGGQGFIGHNLVMKLLKEGHTVRVFDRLVRNDLFQPMCEYFTGEFTELNKYEEMFNEIDVVFHLVSTTLPKTSNDNPSFDIDSNVINTVKLLEICCRKNVRKVVFTSSGGTVYGLPQAIPITEEHPTKPVCSYGITKLMIEKYLYMFNYLYGLEYQILRISNPYGPYQNPFAQQGAIGVFLGKILKNEEIEIWGDGSVCRDYIYIKDVIEALYISAHKDTTDKILNIGSGTGKSLNEIIKIISKVTAQEINISYKTARKLDTPISVLDVSKAKEQLEWYPKYEIEAGIKETWEWLNKNF